MHGFINLLKPPGMTSHDAVAIARRCLGQRRVGHTGTLDPAAAGVLILTAGWATRLSEYLLDEDKSYWAEVALGLQTDSGDADGKVTGQTSAADLTETALLSALAELRGPVTMIPPVHSAIRVGGRKLYQRARAGETVIAPPRQVTIYDLQLHQWLPGEIARVRLEVRCSKGTYIRSLAEMLGQRLGCGGCLAALLRTAVGPYSLAQSITLDELAADPAGCLIPVAEGLPHLPQICLPDPAVQALRHGQPTAAPVDLPREKPVMVCDESGRLVCITAPGPGPLRPVKVMPPDTAV
jgi:tRNA pseudouridine55 synthase